MEIKITQREKSIFSTFKKQNTGELTEMKTLYKTETYLHK